MGRLSGHSLGRRTPAPGVTPSRRASRAEESALAVSSLLFGILHPPLDPTLAASVVHASFRPQVFFSRLPMSEVLAQVLFLSGLAP